MALHEMIILETAEDLTTNDVQSIFIIDAIISVFSLLGGIFNIFTAFYIGNIKNSLGKMVVCLSIADMISSLIVILLAIPTTSEVFCQMQAFWIYFGYAGSFFWTCCFAHALYTVIEKRQFEVVQSNLKIYIILSIVVASSIGTLSIITQFREINTHFNYCMHVGVEGKTTWPQLFVVTIPSLISVLYCIICYAVLTKKLKQMGAHITLELLLYPLVLIVCTGPATFIEVYMLINPGFTVSSGWIILNYSLYVSQGIVNAGVYGFSRTVMNGYRQNCCQKRNKETPEEVTLEVTSVNLHPRMTMDISL